MKGKADKIFISVSSFGDCDIRPLEDLRKSGLEIVRNPYGRRLKPEEVVSLGKDCAGILAGLETLNEDVLKKLPKLKVISRIGIGIDNIDIEAAKKRGIKICNTPDSPTRAVSELAIGFIFDLLRKVSLMDKELRKGKWTRIIGTLLEGKTVGIVGLGRIGRGVANLLRGFGVSIVAYDIAPRKVQSDIRMVELDALLKMSDIVMIHTSGKDCVIGAREIAFMKDGAYIINVSRGEAIDEDALCNALKNGKVAGAALDVFDKEPYTGPLAGLDNVILTPHIGSYTKESRIAMETEAVRNLLDALKG